MHMKAVTERAREAALGIIVWSNQSRCWCNRWLAANGEGKLQPYLNEWRQRRIRRTWSVSRCTGQQHHLLVKVWTVYVKTGLSWYVQVEFFFFPQIFLLFLLSFCLVIVQCLLCCFCSFLCFPLCSGFLCVLWKGISGFLTGWSRNLVLLNDISDVFRSGFLMQILLEVQWDYFSVFIYLFYLYLFLLFSWHFLLIFTMDPGYPTI